MGATTWSETWYEIRETVGVGRLPNTYGSLKEAEEAIDKSNRNAEKRGVEPRQYLVTKVEQSITMTARGKLQRRELKEVAVRTYPKKKGKE